MDSSDMSLVRPVAGLQKPAKVSKTGQHEQRHRQPPRENKEEEEETRATAAETDAEVSPSRTLDDDPHTIDFRA